MREWVIFRRVVAGEFACVGLDLQTRIRNREKCQADQCAGEAAVAARQFVETDVYPIRPSCAERHLLRVQGDDNASLDIAIAQESSSWTVSLAQLEIATSYQLLVCIHHTKFRV